MEKIDHKAFKSFYGNARKVLKQFRYMRDAGPFGGHYFRRGHMWESQNGWINLKAGHVATFYEICSELRKVKGKNYKRSEIATLRNMNSIQNLAKRLPR